MKKSVFLFIVFAICCSAYGQVFKTKTVFKKEVKISHDFYSTTVIIGPKTIKILKWNNGRSEDAILNIDKMEIKPYDGIDCYWYYCTDAKKDEITGVFYKSICVVNNSEKSMIYANFADDVTMFWYKLYFN